MLIVQRAHRRAGWEQAARCELPGKILHPKTAARQVR
jgi:hypothetical protein